VIVLILSAFVASVLGWTLLLAALTGNWWAAAGWAFAITNSVAAGSFLAVFAEPDTKGP